MFQNPNIPETFASLIPTILNSIAIIILNFIYENKVVVQLTELENHRTITEMEDSLILKLFYFSFVNFSNSLVIIAVVKEYVTTFGTCISPSAVYTYNLQCFGELELQI